MSELITQSAHLVLLLPRFGLKLGFGDKTIGEVCSKHNVDTEFFLLICNVYSVENYIPSVEKLIGINMDLLVPYLKASHNYYLHKRLPHIETHLEHITSCLPKHIKEIIKVFFNNYKLEVEAHFHFEESVVYPHINTLLTHHRDEQYSICNFLDAHSNIEDKLDDLKQIIFKYLPETENNEDESISIIFDILQLSNDLKKHAIIEEKVLVPYVSHLEQVQK